MNLLDRSEATSATALIQLEGAYYQESQLLTQHQADGARGLVFQVYLQKLILACIFQQTAAAVDYAQQAAQHLDAVIGSLLIPTFYFYDSLAHLAHAVTVDSKQRPALLKKVKHNQHKLLPYTQHAAMNYQHKYTLVAAEFAYLTAEYAQARELYDAAIQQAFAHEFLAEAALIQERTGQFYLARQMPKLARLYLTDALHSYRRWGAQAKVAQMETDYSHLLAQSAWQQLKTHSELTHYNSSADLELASILKAAQVFASKIVLERLLTKMMNITLEHAGAQRGLLVLNRQGQWYIEAEQDLEHDQMVMLKSLPLDSSEALSVGIVYYVARTRQALVLSDALHSPRFANDAYIIKQQPKSVLCVPLLHQGQLTGLLYLENNLAMGVFTTNRLNLINLLSTQMAIAIENARLYADLEAKVKTRSDAPTTTTQELTHFDQEQN
jgi:GAF domain-containing protein